MDRFAAAALTLIDGDLSLKVRPVPATAGDPIACRSWDLGAPDVRITSTPRPGADGVDEGGGYLGSRTVTLDLLIRGDGRGRPDGHDPYWYAEKLMAMCHPARRPVLKLERHSESHTGPAYLGLRGDPWSLTFERASAAMLTLQLSFTAPGGLLESELWTVTSGTAEVVERTDWHFPAPFPKGFGPTSAGTNTLIKVAGSSPVNPILYISGPSSNPALQDDGGQQFRFSGLNLVAGQTVQINMGTGSVLVADPETGWTDTAADVIHTVDFERSTFWQWAPGTHTVAMTNGTGSYAVQWRDKFLTF